MYQMKHYKKGNTRQDENLSRRDEGSEEESNEIGGLKWRMMWSLMGLMMD